MNNSLEISKVFFLFEALDHNKSQIKKIDPREQIF